MARLRDLAVLQGLSRRELADVERRTQTRQFRAGEVVVEEGTTGTELYVLLSGSAEVVRCDRRGVEFVVADIEPGELVGEVAAIEKKPRTASVRAREPSTFAVLPTELLSAQPKLVINIARAMSERLREHSDLSLDHARERAAAGELLIKTLVLLCGYSVLLSSLPWIRATWPGTSTTYVSLPIIAVFGYSSYRFLRSTGWPLSRFGLGFRNLFGSLLEAVVLTPPFAALLVGVKWLVLRIVPAYRGLPTFAHDDMVARLLDPSIRWLLVVYAASAFVQELIVRCALQASLEDFLSGRGRTIAPIFVSALMFSVNHLHMSFMFAALAFIPGVFWGILFHRKRHLAGVALSHFAIGAFVFFVLGVRLD